MRALAATPANNHESAPPEISRRLEYLKSLKALSEAFDPLVAKLRSVLRAQSPAQIADLAHQLERESPVLGVRYEGWSTHFTDARDHDLAAETAFNAKKGLAPLGVLDPITLQPTHQFGRFDRALYVRNVALGGFEAKSPFAARLAAVITPVGAYGDDFAKSMLRTTQMLMFIAASKLQTEARRVYNQNAHLLARNAIRASRASDIKTNELSSLNVFLEGILSLHQLFAINLGAPLLSASTGPEALRMLIFDGNHQHGLPSDFTSQLHSGFVGPMALGGVYFSQPLTWSDGRLAVPASLKRTIDQLTDARHEENSRLINEWRAKFGSPRAEPGEQRPHKLKGVCPMALMAGASSDKTGIQQLAEMYWDVFAKLNSAKGL